MTIFNYNIVPLHVLLVLLDTSLHIKPPYVVTYRDIEYMFQLRYICD